MDWESLKAFSLSLFELSPLTCITNDNVLEEVRVGHVKNTS